MGEWMEGVGGWGGGVEDSTEQANRLQIPDFTTRCPQMALKGRCSATWEVGASDSSTQLQSTDRPPEWQLRNFIHLRKCMFLVEFFFDLRTTVIFKTTECRERFGGIRMFSPLSEKNSRWNLWTVTQQWGKQVFDATGQLTNNVRRRFEIRRSQSYVWVQFLLYQSVVNWFFFSPVLV